MEDFDQQWNWFYWMTDWEFSIEAIATGELQQ